MRDRTAYYRAYYLANKDRLRPMRRTAQKKYNKNRERTDAERLAHKLVRCMGIKIADARIMVREMQE